MLGYSKMQIMGNIGQPTGNPTSSEWRSGSELQRGRQPPVQRPAGKHQGGHRPVSSLQWARRSLCPVSWSRIGGVPGGTTASPHVRFEERRTGVRRDHSERGAVPGIASRSRGCNAATREAQILQSAIDGTEPAGNRRKDRRSILRIDQKGVQCGTACLSGGL